MATQQPKQLSPQQRAANFATMTRQTFQMLPSTKAEELSTVTFDLPKARFLSKLVVEVDAVATLTSANGSIPKSTFSPYDILRRISLDLNNGFSPYVVSGRDAYMYNLNRLNPDVLNPSDEDRSMAYVETTASAGGTDARVKFSLELPVTLNDRDPVGLILLQNAETNVQLTIDVDKVAKAYNLASGDTVELKSMTITPMVETFTIPPVETAHPDISVLKLVHSKGDVFGGNGQNIVKLNVGTVYRKMVLYFEDQDGVPLTDADFSGNLELIFNQADIPYSIKPTILSSKNHSQLGFPLPDGCFILDFSNQGLPNFGGSRDYIDTERLTEFWVRFNTQKAGKLTVISETLSRLR
jgi:hypothetical protein